VRDMRAELKRLWTASKAASAPPAAFELLQRDLDQRMKRDIEALLEGEQREAYRQWEERRQRPAGEPQARRENEDEKRRVRAELAAYEQAMQRAGFMQLATSLQLTPEQRQRLEMAHQAEQNEAKRLWTEPKADAAEALRTLEQWQAIRTRTNEQLREVLRAEQLDRYREWCDTQAAPRQMTMGGRAWWGEGDRMPVQQRQDDM